MTGRYNVACLYIVTMNFCSKYEQTIKNYKDNLAILIHISNLYKDSRHCTQSN